MAKSTAVRLKDPETTFYDPETKFKVTRDEVVEVGAKKGKLTIQAINAGGLIEVNRESKAAAKDEGGKKAEGSKKDEGAKKGTGQGPSS